MCGDREATLKPSFFFEARRLITAANMTDFSADRFLKEATPQPGDPTFSILRTHLLMEDLLRTFLEKVAVNPAAIGKAKLTFSQVLQVTRAFCPNISQDNWMWKAIADLNKLRNDLAHNLNPAELQVRLNAYMDLVINASNVPLPEPNFALDASASAKFANSYGSIAKHKYYKIDMANIGLYASVAGALGLASVD